MRGRGFAGGVGTKLVIKGLVVQIPAPTVHVYEVSLFKTLTLNLPQTVLAVLCVAAGNHWWVNERPSESNLGQFI